MEESVSHYQPADIERLPAPLERLPAPQPPISRKVTFIEATGETNEKFVALAERLKKDDIYVATISYATNEHWGVYWGMRYSRVVVFGRREALEGENFGSAQLEARVMELAKRSNTPVLLYPSSSENDDDLIDAIMKILNS